MMVLNAKFLDVKELPARDPFPPSTLLTLLSGSETINLVGPESLAQQLSQVKELTPLLVELGWKKLDLASLGASTGGNAYRLKALRLVDPKELAG